MKIKSSQIWPNPKSQKLSADMEGCTYLTEKIDGELIANLLTAATAASDMRDLRSAATKPGVSSAIFSTEKSDDIVRRRQRTLSIPTRAARSGMPMQTSLSNLK